MRKTDGDQMGTPRTLHQLFGLAGVQKREVDFHGDCLSPVPRREARRAAREKRPWPPFLRLYALPGLQLHHQQITFARCPSKRVPRQWRRVDSLNRLLLLVSPLISLPSRSCGLVGKCREPLGKIKKLAARRASDSFYFAASRGI